jgi:ABC-type microcin C transport system duplicated ATPase subunit YejF
MVGRIVCESEMSVLFERHSLIVPERFSQMVPVEPQGEWLSHVLARDAFKKADALWSKT